MYGSTPAWVPQSEMSPARLEGRTDAEGRVRPGWRQLVAAGGLCMDTIQRPFYLRDKYVSVAWGPPRHFASPRRFQRMIIGLVPLTPRVVPDYSNPHTRGFLAEML
jgi:hypothetical protein